KLLFIINEIQTQVNSIFVGGQIAESSVSIRTNLLKNVIVFVENSFGFGIGVGNSEHYMKTKAVFPTANQYNVHNWFAEIMANYGIIIFVLYVLLYIYLVITLIKICRKSTNTNEKMISEALL